jgi:purine-nucleoside phosphorylase
MLFSIPFRDSWLNDVFLTGIPARSSRLAQTRLRPQIARPNQDGKAHFHGLFQNQEVAAKGKGPER